VDAAVESAERRLVTGDPQSPWKAYSERQRWLFLIVLFLVSTSNYADRYVISVLLEPIKREFQVSDASLGLLSGLCFALFYTAAGVPIARWADRGNRRTIITLTLTLWSVMTMLCGLAQSFWHLIAARIGVGVGEAGAISPAQSLIADYFPPERRASALAVFTSASSAGYVLGIGGGGFIAAMYDWRMAFILVGLPGLALAVWARYALAEPRLTQNFIRTRATAEVFSESFARLRAKRTFRLTLYASITYFFVLYGALIFIPSFLIRSLAMSLSDISFTLAIVMAVSSMLGAIGGGFAADFLGRRSIRWLALIPAIGFGVAAPAFQLAFLAPHVWLFMTIASLGYALLAAAAPAIYATVHAVCGNDRRATAVAIVLFSSTLIGGGFGPLATGLLSDALSAAYGTAGLQVSLISMTAILFVSAALCYRASRSLPAELER
jgi:predicted MFS family arabinose efflux permease